MSKQQARELFTLAQEYTRHRLLSEPDMQVPLSFYISDAEGSSVGVFCTHQNDEEKHVMLDAVRALCIAMDARAIATAAECWVVPDFLRNRGKSAEWGRPLHEHPDAVEALVFYGADKSGIVEQDIQGIVRSESGVSLSAIPDLPADFQLRGNMAHILPVVHVTREMASRAEYLFEQYAALLPRDRFEAVEFRLSRAKKSSPGLAPH